MTLPRATMRLQLYKAFTLDDARAIVPYIAALGISHLYLSPILTARPGSSHGYDVVDPTRVNPELGGEDALRRLVNFGVTNWQSSSTSFQITWRSVPKIRGGWMSWRAA